VAGMVRPAAAVVVLAAAGIVAAGLVTAGPSPDSTASHGPEPSSPTSSVPASQARRTGSVAAQPPAAVRLPSGTRVPVVAVATRANGVLDVPDDVAAAGWWSGGSRVGDPFGATLLAGHVDSVELGLGAYAELLAVRPRQRIRLSSAHLEQQFVIHSLRLIAKGDIARDPRLWSPRGDRRLVLVTCAPPYDPARGGYQRLAVVTALPVGDARDRRSP
jgi:hypothetical protein